MELQLVTMICRDILIREVYVVKIYVYHKHRSLERAYKRYDWIKTNIDYSTNLRKDYGLVDLDKYHFMVLNIKEKGSSSYIDINGYTTKLGYTTGITAIDLCDYDDKKIKGIQNVNIGIDLRIIIPALFWMI